MRDEFLNYYHYYTYFEGHIIITIVRPLIFCILNYEYFTAYLVRDLDGIL